MLCLRRNYQKAKTRPEDEAEANLPGHLRPENTVDLSEEDDGSSSYVPEEKDKDTQLQYALDLVRGAKSIAIGGVKKTDAN